MKYSFVPLALSLTGYLVPSAKAQTPDASAAPASASAATGPSASSAPSCELKENDESSTLEMSFTEKDSEAKEPLTVYYVNVIPKGNDSVQSSMSLKIVKGSDTIFTTDRSSSPDGSVNVELDWLPSTDKSHTASFTVDSSNLTTGTVDSKKFDPIPLNDADSTSALERRDEPLLKVAPPSDLNISPSRIQKMLVDGLKACESKIKSLPDKEAPPNDTQEETPDLLPRQSPSQDLGQLHPWTRWTLPCRSCIVGASFAVDIFESTCIAKYCLWNFGPKCCACRYKAHKLRRAAYKKCYKSSACCPVRCGDYNEKKGTCCNKGAQCLNSEKALCCAKGKTPCAGKSCCAQGQACLKSGSLAGKCCPKGSVPWKQGTQCCWNKVCGNKCCATADPTKSGLTPGPNYCADASKSLCCPKGKVAKNGICCKSNENNCGGKCCSGKCRAGRRCEVTDEDCKSKGYLGSCQKVKNCGHKWWNSKTVCLPNQCCAKK